MIFLNDDFIEPTFFPDKTSQIWKLHADFLLKRESIIRWEYQDESELIRVAQLKDLLDSYGVVSDLSLPYLPYGRQDKVISNDATFALRTFAKLLNSLSFRFVLCTDPHSAVAGDLINNFKPTYPSGIVLRACKEEKIHMLCYPDYGALTKYSKIFPSREFVYGEKIRDQATGQITSYIFNGAVGGKNILIVDDICDGGATFVLLAKALKAKNAKNIHLYVSHGLFTKGIAILKDAGISRIYTKEGKIT